MSRNVMKASEVKMDNVRFQDPKILDNGGKMVFLSYNEKMLMVQTPIMHMPWNMKRDEYDGVVKYTLDLQFKDTESNQEMREFHNLLEEFDEKLIEMGVKNSMSWFKKKNQKREICEELINSHIIRSKDKETGEVDGKWPDRIKVKIPQKNGVFTSKVYDVDKSIVEDSEYANKLVKGCEVRAILEHGGVWLAGSKYGGSWRVKALEIVNAPDDAGYAFLDSSDDDE